MEKTQTSKQLIIICAIFLAVCAFSSSAKAQFWGTSGNSGFGLMLGTTSNDSLDLITDGVNRLVIHSNGNVGIGTSKTTSYLLSVNGDVRAREVVVNTSTWSDYVFSKDYKLPDLKILEKQIKEERHLPGVPTTEEVVNKGVPVGEMEKILLQKVEELTLYIIQQQKEINELKKEIKKQ